MQEHLGTAGGGLRTEMTAVVGAHPLRTLLLWWALALTPWLAWGQGVLPVPELRARVIDQTGTLDAASVAAIEAKLAAFEQSNGSQVVVVMVATTAPEDIADYTQRLGDAWKIGRADVGDGVLFVIAKDDRRLRIAPAKALEGALPDLLARRILDQTVTPAFRRGDYAGGIEAGVDQILAVIRGEGLPEPAAPRADAGGDWTEGLFFLLFAIPMVAGFMRNAFGHSACEFAQSHLFGGAACLQSVNGGNAVDLIDHLVGGQRSCPTGREFQRIRAACAGAQNQG